MIERIFAERRAIVPGVLCVCLAFAGLTGCASNDIDGGKTGVSSQPQIASFDADPAEVAFGESTTLSWQVVAPEGTTLFITPDVGDVTGQTSVVVTPSETQTYTLTASNDAGEASAEVDVTVVAGASEPPEISSFTAEPNAVMAGEELEFSWSVSDPDGDEASCIIDVEDDGQKDYTIEDCLTTNTAQLHAYDTAGEYTARLKVFDAEGQTAEATVSVSVSENGAPTLTVVEDQRVIENTVVQQPAEHRVSFDVDDPDAAHTIDSLTLEASADTAAVIPSTEVECAGGSCEVVLSVVSDTEGQSTVTLTATDPAGETATADFVVTVGPRLVTTVDDTGAGSLREAVTDSAAGDVIAFDLSTPTAIFLETQIEIEETLTIEGPGRDAVSLDGQDISRIFVVNENADVHLSSLMMVSGFAPVSKGGGAIKNDGTLRVVDVAFKNNISDTDSGGAIKNEGDLVVRDSYFESNEADFGGAIYTKGDGMVTVERTTFRDNFATATGGAVYAQASADFFDTTFVFNEAGNHGGAILIDDLQPNTVVRVWNSTLTGNVVGVNGGAIFNLRSAVHIGFSTIVDNVAQNSGGESGGGGIRNSGGTLTMTGSILANNTANGGTNWTGEIDSGGYNLVGTIDDGTMTGDTTGNVTDAAPQIAALADNGGPTWTHELQPGSPAIDKVPATNCVDIDGNALTADQRGETRPQGESCDIGAFEVQ